MIGVVGIGQDITGRLAQEREYTRLIDTANAPIFGVDTQGRVNVWNQCAMRLVGYSNEEGMFCCVAYVCQKRSHLEYTNIFSIIVSHGTLSCTGVHY